MADKPNIFAYDDYRKYVGDLVSFLKTQNRAFSFRYFAREAGFSSQSTLKLVMDGKRRLTHKSVPKICKGLKLSAQEAEFFENLVFFNQAESSDEKNRYFQRMSKNQRYRQIRNLEARQFEYLSNWYYPAVRELINFSDFQENPAWIARRLHPHISEREAKRALNLLLKLGLVEKGTDGRLQQTSPALTTGAEVKSLAVKNFHRAMSERAVASLDSVKASQRDISGITLGIPSKRVGELKTLIDQFRKDIASSLGSFQEPADEIYHLNIQLFPLTDKEKK